MPLFEYIAVDDAGQRVRGTIPCADRRDAGRQLLARGCHPVSIDLPQERLGGARRLWRAIARRVTVQERAVFTRQMASLLKAGLPIVGALATLRRQAPRGALGRIVQEMEQRIGRDGGSFAQALDEHPRVFDAVYRGLARSGEAGGNLVEVLSRLATQLTQGAKLRRQVGAALLYPAFLLLLGTAAIYVLVAVVVPRFEDLFRSFDQALPAPTRALLAVSAFLSAYWWAVPGAVGALVVAAFALLRRSGVRRWIDGCLLRLPIVGGLLMKLEVARLSNTLAALLEGGVRILEALRVAGEGVGNRRLRTTFPRILQEVSRGQPLSSAMEQAKFFPPLMLGLVRTGEETGELPEMLRELSRIYEDQSEQAVHGAVRLLEPVLILLMGGCVAAIVAAILLPIFEANAMVR